MRGVASAALHSDFKSFGKRMAAHEDLVAQIKEL
jgi:hypothetical protein